LLRRTSAPALARAVRPRSIGVEHRLRLRNRKQQSHVDVDAERGQRLERTDAFGRAGHLDQQVAAVDLPRQPLRLGYRMGGVIRPARRDLQADIAVVAAAGFVYRQQQVARGLDVGDRQRLEAPLGIRLAGLEARQVVGVMRAVGECILEDRRIRGHARHPVFGDQLRQRAVADQVARQVVQPEALAERGDVLRGIHGRSFRFIGIQDRTQNRTIL